MPITRCSANKHYYDINVHDSCPYCGSEDGQSYSNILPDEKINDFDTSLKTQTLKTQTFEMNDTTELMTNNFGYDETLKINGEDETIKVEHGNSTVMLDTEKNRASPNVINFDQDNETEVAVRPSKLKTQIFGLSSNSLDVSNDRLNQLPVTGWLVIIDGPGIGTDFRLIQGENRIGRNPDMEVCLNFGKQSDDMVSRDSHAIIVYDNHANVFFVERGRSRNLPLLNNKTIRSGEDIESGDIIQVGGTKLMLVALCNESFTWNL